MKNLGIVIVQKNESWQNRCC